MKNEAQNEELTFSQEVKQTIQEFKQSWSGESNIETINSDYRYNQVVDDLVDSVLSLFDEMAENADDYADYEYIEALEEVVGNSAYCIYTAYAREIYSYSPFDECELDVSLENFDRIDQAIQYFAIRSLEQSVKDNEYVSRILELVEERG